MKQWIFATNNAHKLDEAKDIFNGFAEIISLQEIGFHDEVEETEDSFKGNALLKAQAVFQKTGLPCFADDSGLCVDALDGKPGVKSARYANETGPVDHALNNQKLLQNLSGVENRNACFKTVICAVGFEPEPLFFEGIVYGQITTELKGNDGFGYDPLFVPQNYHETFAELGSVIKNTLSHRWMAMEHMKKHFSH
jgi:XTP/dITP diphosphohydrolase